MQHLRSLGRKKGRREADRTLVEGSRSVSLALDQERVEVVEVLRVEGKGESLLERCKFRSVPVTTIRESDLERLSDVQNSQGVLAVIRPPRASREDLTRNRGLLVALDRVQDPGNAGAILRNAWAFGAEGILFGRGSVEAFAPKVIRASAGGVLAVPVMEDQDLPEELGRLSHEGRAVLGTAGKGGISADGFDFRSGSVLVFGSEGSGLSEAVRDLCDHQITVMHRPEVESLNVAVSAGILMAFYWARTR